MSRRSSGWWGAWWLALVVIAGAARAEEVALEGDLVVGFRSDPDGCREVPRLRVGDRTFDLAAPTVALDRGRRVVVRGQRQGDLITGTVEPRATSALAKAAAGPQGALRTLVILVNFQERPDDRPWTAEFMRQQLDAVSDLWREVSYDRCWFTTEVTGWHTLPLSVGDAREDRIAALAQAAARDAGHDPAGYDRLVYGFPRVDRWGWSGQADDAPGRHVWLNGNAQVYTIAHELGHTLGLWHSRFAEGATLAETPTTVVPTFQARHQEYGDVFDFMGSGPMHPNALQKEILGFLGVPGAPPITTVTQSGIYRIEALEGMGAGARALKLRAGQDAWYYVECRRPGGASQALLEGVLLHRTSWSWGPTSALLHGAPATSSSAEAAPLPVGHTFHDRASGLSVRPVAVDATGATVEVILTAPAAEVPLPVALFSGAAVGYPSVPWLQPGEHRRFYVTVENEDRGVASTTLDLEVELPAGWTSSWDQGVSRLTVEPDKQGRAALDVWVDPAAPDGYEEIVVHARHPAGRAYDGHAVLGHGVGDQPMKLQMYVDRPVGKLGDVVTIFARVTIAGVPVPRVWVSARIIRPSGGGVDRSMVTDAQGRASAGFWLGDREPTGTYRVVAQARMVTITANATTRFHFSRGGMDDVNSAGVETLLQPAPTD